MLLIITSAAICIGVRPSSISRLESAPDLSSILVLVGGWESVSLLIIIIIVFSSPSTSDLWYIQGKWIFSSYSSSSSSSSDHIDLEHCSPLASSILEAICNGASPILPPLIWTWNYDADNEWWYISWCKTKACVGIWESRFFGRSVKIDISFRTRIHLSSALKQKVAKVQKALCITAGGGFFVRNVSCIGCTCKCNCPPSKTRSHRSGS